MQAARRKEGLQGRGRFRKRLRRAGGGRHRLRRRLGRFARDSAAICARLLQGVDGRLPHRPLGLYDERRRVEIGCEDMPLQLFTHPFASYCQKVLIALYENETPFTPRMLDQSSDPATFAEFEALWPLKKFPLLLGGGRAIAEATIIIEYLDIHYPGPRRMIPADPESAL